MTDDYLTQRQLARLAEDEAWIAGLPDHLQEAARRIFPPGRPRQEDYDGGPRSVTPDRSRQVKRRNRKSFRVRLLNRRDPQATVDAVWAKWQTPKDPGWHMIGGQVDGNDALLALVYVGGGGVPSDIDKQVGNYLDGVRLPEHARVIELVETVVLEAG